MLLVEVLPAAHGRREVRAPMRFQDEFKSLYRNSEAPSTSKAIGEHKAAVRLQDQQAKKDQKHAHLMGLRKRAPINYAEKGRRQAPEKEKEKEKAKEKEQEKAKGKGKGKEKEKENAPKKGKGKKQEEEKAKGKKRAAAAPLKPAKGKAPLKAKAKAKARRKGWIPPRAPFRFNPAPPAGPLFGFNAPLNPVVRPLEELLRREDSPSAKRRAAGLAVAWDPQGLTPELFDLNLAHLKEVVPPLYDELPLADVTANELLTILKETDILPKDLDPWKAYAGHNLFNSKEDMARNLETVVSYCENDAQAGKGIKNKLRLVTQILKEDHDARSGILVMLAQHGGVCNIMKELAVNLAYSLLSNNLKDFINKQSLKTLILRHLQTLRSLISEELYLAGGAYMNSHPIIAFQNGLAQYIGLEEIPDVHQAKNLADEERVKNFFGKYTPERITKALSSAMNGKERKIPYDTVVEWLQQHPPKEREDPYEFLSECFDDKGHFTQPAILYILLNLDILA